LTSSKGRVMASNHHRAAKISPVFFFSFASGASLR
jgi:hypothetical protein